MQNKNINKGYFQLTLLQEIRSYLSSRKMGTDPQNQIAKVYDNYSENLRNIPILLKAY